MNPRIKGYISIILHGLFIGFSFLAIKISLTYSNAFDLLSHRFSITALIIIIYGFFNKDIKQLNFHAFKTIFPLSLFYPVLFFLFQTLGLSITSSSEAGIIYALSPIITFLVAKVLIHEKAEKIQILFMIISVSGLVIINIGNGLNPGYSNYSGIFLILLSASSISVYNVLLKKIAQTFTPVQITYVISIYGFIIFTLIAIIKHLILNDLPSYFSPLMKPEFLAAVFYLALFASLLSNITAAYALTKLEATTVSLFQNLATIYIILLGILILKENLYFYHYIGITAVLAGIVGFTLKK